MSKRGFFSISFIVLASFMLVACQQAKAPNTDESPAPTEPSAPSTPTPEPTEPVNPGDEGPPATPTGFTVAARNNTIEISWNQNTESDISAYIISWDTTKGDNYANQFEVASSQTSAELTDLDYGQSYFFVIAAKDKEGLESAASAGRGVTLPAQDTVAPSISSFLPSGEEVALDEKIVFRFSEAMDSNGYLFSIDPSVEITAQKWSDDQRSLMIDAALQGNTSYTVSISISDLAGNFLVGSTAFNFKTATPPNLKSSSPRDKEENVPTDSVISIRFTQSMNRESVEETLIFEPEIKCDFSWEFKDQLVTCKPTELLKEDADYLLTLSNEIESASGLKFEGATIQFSTTPR